MLAHQAAAQIDVLVRGLAAVGGQLGREQRLAALGVHPQRAGAAGLGGLNAAAAAVVQVGFDAEHGPQAVALVEVVWDCLAASEVALHVWDYLFGCRVRKEFWSIHPLPPIIYPNHE